MSVLTEREVEVFENVADAVEQGTRINPLHADALLDIVVRLDHMCDQLKKPRRQQVAEFCLARASGPGKGESET